MVLNDAGKTIEKWYYELENKFNDIKCRSMVVMPNHFHCIIENVGGNALVGADLRVCPNEKHICPNEKQVDVNNPNPVLGEHKPNVILGEHIPVLGEHKPNVVLDKPNVILGEHIGSPLHAIIQWLKTMTTNEYIRGVKNYGWQRFDGKLWQRNYWEHIIRNENEYDRINQYIINNPTKWYKDKLNIGDNNTLKEPITIYGNEPWMI
jgi:REP element-mobilizing transposase RayT